MIQYVLFLNRGQWYSVTDLRNAVEQKFQEKLYRKTIAAALSEIDYSTGMLDEDFRAGRYNKQIKIYSITN